MGPHFFNFRPKLKDKIKNYKAFYAKMQDARRWLMENEP